MSQRRHKRDPLSLIPPSDLIAHSLREVETEAKQLRILLRTAREIEKAAKRPEPAGVAS
ncbi:hypothetical protein Pan216_16200 [Planctomycetes bacterium Pan216]|uniref:Uncharacterized protein n=1 Tax=Kolteria novifilia TaxID=2527975 RepID=A0A518B1A8_9BACT|nr:hypothetical protein Pan216_16200 [Planctomycetes bacterium Pan216]